MTDRCPHCGQKMPRNGVEFPPLKARIFAAVKRAGPDGISSDDLRLLIYDDRATSRHTLKAHVFQINEMIEGTGLRISGRGGSYVLRRL